MIFYIVMYLLSLFLVCDIGMHRPEGEVTSEEQDVHISVEPSESVVVEDF